MDSQFPAVTEKIVAALKELSPAPLRLLVNTHVHGDHTGGNENFAKLGVIILGRPSLREQLLKPLKLTAQETDDLIVFVESLTDFRTNWKRSKGGEPTCK